MPDEPTDQPPTNPPAPPVSPPIARLKVQEGVPRTRRRIGDVHLLYLTFLALGLGMVSALVAEALFRLIGLFTNIAFHGNFVVSTTASPVGFTMGWWVIFIPVIGGLIVGLMARYGSEAISGHGIPEAMEQVLEHQSRIPARIIWLKPLSAAIAIGTGGPFGVEGPIIATGGALGSVLGQLLPSSPDDRKALLAAGAAAGMSATFGSPISGVLMAVELLLFEFRPRSLIPVCVASAAAAGLRALLFTGGGPIFAMSHVPPVPTASLGVYALLGVVVGLASILATKAVGWTTDFFVRTPIPWMWWPAIGALPVGIIGYFSPHTLGVGYDNITNALNGNFTVGAVVSLAVLKCISWAVSLGSGTSGGTLAPLFTIGGGTGLAVGWVLQHVFPDMGVNLQVAAMVGMGAMFAGASRALLTSVVFVVETTFEPHGLAPLLLGCAMAYLVSALLMRETIMTDKIARKGIHVPTDYLSDPLESALVSEAMTTKVISLKAEDTVRQARQWLASGEEGSGHQGFAVVDHDGKLVGMITRSGLLRRDLSPDSTVRDAIAQDATTIRSDAPAAEAEYLMIHFNIARLAVVDESGHLVGIITRGDVLGAQHPDWKPAGRPPRPPVGHPAVHRPKKTSKGA
jgi:H+/Cl- antiporter ClcA/predicted transcriptional regulator